MNNIKPYNFMIKKILIAVMLFLGASLNISAQNDVVTNETVLELLKEGFSSEEIIGAIENSSTRTIHSTSSLCVNSSKLVLMPR